MENKAIKMIVLSIISKLVGELIEIFNKNPNKKTEKVVKIALSLNKAP